MLSNKKNTNLIELFKENFSIIWILILGLFSAFVFDSVSEFWQPLMKHINISTSIMGLMFSLGAILLFFGFMVLEKYEKALNNKPFIYEAAEK